MGLDKPDEGQILVEGEDITRMNERELVGVRQKIGMVFQESALFDSLTVRENVAYRLYETGRRTRTRSKQSSGEPRLRRTRRRDRQNAVRAFRRHETPRRAGARADRRAGDHACTTNRRPVSIPITSKKINELIIALRDIKRVTGVFVTHRMRDAFTLATEYATNGDEQIHFQTEGNFLCIANTRFLMLRDGKIVFEGPDEVLRRSEDDYIKRFLK